MGMNFQSEYDLKNFSFSSVQGYVNMEIETLISERNKYIQINRSVDLDIIVAMKHKQKIKRRNNIFTENY